MNGQPTETREPLDSGLTEEVIQKLIAERAEEGGECRVVEEDGQKVLICKWSPL